MATLLYANGDSKEVQPTHGEHFTLEELQGYVGGYIEMFALNDGRAMFFNENGKYLPLDTNFHATRLAKASGLLTSDWIVGDAIVCDISEIE